MKKKKVFASVAALAMAVVTVFSAGNTVKAAEVTDSPRIKLNIETEAEEKSIDEEYFSALAKYLGWSSGTDGVSVQTEDEVSFTFDLEGTGYTRADIKTLIFQTVAPCYRDANGELQFLKSIDLGMNEIAIQHRVNEPDESYQEFYDNKIYLDQKNTFSLDNTELYVIRVVFTDGSYHDELVIPADYKEYEGDMSQSVRYSSMWSSYYKDYFLEQTGGIDTFSNVHLAKNTDIPSDDTSDSEDYTLDMTTSTTPVSSETFATLLAENATKDIVIKSNNNVTFTFAKSTMQNVDGKDSYDFSTTMNNTYSEEMPYYITQNNFVSCINFNYSGTLPAEASIRFYAGTQYAGQTLFYSLMNEDKTFAEVQAVVVDAEGYMTVKQNHCSSYVVTTEEPKVQSDNTVVTPGNQETTATQVTTGNTDNTTATEGKVSPQTGDNSNFIILYALIAVSAMGILLTIRKYKKA